MRAPTLLLRSLAIAVTSFAFCFGADPAPVQLKTIDGRVMIGLVKRVQDGTLEVAHNHGSWVVRLDQLAPESLLALGAHIGPEEARKLFDPAAAEKEVGRLKAENQRLLQTISELQNEALSLRIELETVKHRLEEAAKDAPSRPVAK